MLSKISSYIECHGCIFISYLTLQREIYVVASIQQINLANKGTGYEGIALSEKDSEINIFVNKRDHTEDNKLTKNI